MDILNDCDGLSLVGCVIDCDGLSFVGCIKDCDRFSLVVREDSFEDLSSGVIHQLSTAL